MENRSQRTNELINQDRLRIFRFLVVGCWNAFFSLIVFYFFLFVLGNDFYQFSLLISFILSACQSFLTQSILVWKSQIRDGRRFTHFFLVCLTQYAINALVMFLLVSIFGFSPKLIQVPVSFSIAIGSFFYFKFRVFIENQ